MMKIKLPNVLSRSKLDSFYSKVSPLHKKMESNSLDTEEVVFDFSDCGYVTPCGACALLIERDILISNDISVFAKAEENNKVIQFLKALGLPIGNNNGSLQSAYERRMRGRSVQIKKCTSYDECYECHREITDTIISKVECSKGTEAAIDYMIGEIWDNAGVHGYECYEEENYPMPVYIGAFNYKSKVEVVVADRGQGIHSSLRKNNPDFRNLNAKEAIRRALDNEASGHPENSPGFGLYSTSQFIYENGGQLSMWSSGRSLKIDGNGNLKTYGSDHRVGTLVGFEVNAEVNIPFEQIVQSSGSAEEYLELINGY